MLGFFKTPVVSPPPALIAPTPTSRPTPGSTPIIQKATSDSSIRIIVRGARKVGKTSLLRRMCGGPFTTEYTASRSDTSDTFQWKTPVAGLPVTIEMCEMIEEDDDEPAGLFASLGVSSKSKSGDGGPYAGAAGAIIVVDLRKRETLKVAESLISKVPVSLPILLLGTARDASVRAIHPEDLEALVRNVSRNRTGHVQSLTISLLDCYGLKSLHDYLNVPWLSSVSSRADATLALERAEAKLRETRLLAASVTATNELNRATAAAGMVYAGNASAKEYDAYKVWLDEKKRAQKASIFREGVGLGSGAAAVSDVSSNAAQAEIDALRTRIAQLESGDGKKSSKEKKTKKIKKNDLKSFLKEDTDDDDDDADTDDAAASDDSDSSSSSPPLRVPPPVSIRPTTTTVPVAKSKSATTATAAAIDSLSDFNPSAAGKASFFDNDDDDDDDDKTPTIHLSTTPKVTVALKSSTSSSGGAVDGGGSKLSATALAAIAASAMLEIEKATTKKKSKKDKKGGEGSGSGKKKKTTTTTVTIISDESD